MVSGNPALVAARTEDELSQRYIAHAPAAAQQLDEITRRLREDED